MSTSVKPLLVREGQRDGKKRGRGEKGREGERETGGREIGR